MNLFSWLCICILQYTKAPTLTVTQIQYLTLPAMINHIVISEQVTHFVIKYAEEVNSVGDLVFSQFREAMTTGRRKRAE